MYHGEYTLQETVILTQLNLNMQARDLERMEYNTVQNPGSLSSPRPLAAAALPRKLLLVSLVSECVLHPPWLGLLVRIGVGWWWKSSAWWRGRGKAPP